MKFWSKGLGKKTIDLSLAKGETIHTSGRLYVRGTMEAPVDWDYIMPLEGEDLVDFFDLLRDPSIARYVHQSPRRWRIYGSMLTEGLALGLEVAAAAVKQMLGRLEPMQEIEIQVPPPSVLKKKRKKKAPAKEVDAAEATAPKKRRRLLSRITTGAPSLTTGMKPSAAPAFSAAATSPEEVKEAMAEAMEAAKAIE